MELLFFKLSFGLYALALALALGFLSSKKDWLSLWMWRLLGVGLLCHAVSFILRIQGFWAIPENRWFFPINTFFGALSFLAFAIAAIFWVVEGRHRLGILGAFVLPWCALASGAALFLADPEVSGLVPALQSWWINVHPMVLMGSYAAFANAAGVGLALLVQEHQVKSRKPTELCFRLPSIDELDRLNYRLIAVFFPVLTVGIIMGGIWARESWGRFWGWDAKETWAAITWTVYVIYLHMRLLGGMRGRKTVYVSIAGFVSVIFTFAGVNYLSKLHGYLSGG